MRALLDWYDMTGVTGVPAGVFDPEPASIDEGIESLNARNAVAKTKIETCLPVKVSVE